MGIWNERPFGNDAALDWIGMLEKAPSDAWFTLFSTVLEDFWCFEESRVLGQNVVLRTPEMAQAMIAMFQQPVAPIIQKTILDGVGKFHEYPGDDETFVLIAAAECIHLRLENQLAVTVCDDLVLSLAAVPISLAPQFSKALKSVKLNKIMIHDHGRLWKRNVIALSEAIDNVVAQK